MKKVFCLFVPCLILYSCNKKKEDSNQQGSSHPVSYLHEIQISQYVDTVIAMPVLPENIPGHTAPVTVTFDKYPDWITAIPSSISITPGSFANFGLKVRPYWAGTYPAQFTVNWSSTESQSYSFNVIVNESPDCITYLVGNYKIVSPNVPSYFDKNATGIVASDSAYSFPPIHTPHYIQIVGPKIALSANLNCADKTIHISPRYFSSGTYQGTGTFSNDSVFLHIVRSTNQPLEADSSDIVMVRK